jgi:hypothetical protein
METIDLETLIRVAKYLENHSPAMSKKKEWSEDWAWEWSKITSEVNGIVNRISEKYKIEVTA